MENKESKNNINNRKLTGLFMHFDNGDIINIQDLPKPEYENFLEQMYRLRMAYIVMKSDRSLIKSVNK